MKLAEYLQQEKISPAQFAAKLSKPASTISRVLKEQRTPTLDLMDAIAKETNGAVTPNDFLSDHRRKATALKVGAV
jgi:transcriptional regulator with XRE-family HTH domain